MSKENYQNYHWETCEVCQGYGYFDDEYVPCPHSMNMNGNYLCKSDCNVCHGFGLYKYTGECDMCHGLGKRQIGGDDPNDWYRPSEWTGS